MNILSNFNYEPYGGTDLAWNGLRLAGKLLEAGQHVRIFLMNDAIDLARDVCRPSTGYDRDLGAMLKVLVSRGVPVRVCGTYMACCGIHKNHPYFAGTEQSTMPALAEWVIESDKVVTFQWLSGR